MKLIKKILFLILIAILFFAKPSHALAFAPGFQKGGTIVPHSATDLSSESFRRSLRDLKATHATKVTFVILYWQDSMTTSNIQENINNPTDQSLIDGITYAHSIGLEVELKPHVDTYIYGYWRALIDPTDRPSWFTNYDRIILHYAQIAKQHNVEYFCIGTELTGLTDPAVNASNTGYWIDLIQKMRSAYPGKLTYSAHFDKEWQHLGFWPYLDYIGIGMYFPLSDHPDPTLDEVVQGWSIVDTTGIKALSEHVNKPVVMTEIGYRSVKGASTQPWGGEPYGDVVDINEQTTLYKALFQYWWDKPWLIGMDINGWDSIPENSSLTDTWYSPQNKPAVGIMTDWFGKEPTVTPPATGIGVDKPITTGVTAQATATYSTNTSADKAIDGKLDTNWNAGTTAPQNLTITYDKPHTITKIELHVAQAPSGDTIHNIYMGNTAGNLTYVTSFTGTTYDGNTLTYTLPTPIQNVQIIQVQTAQSPSWIAWREVTAFESTGQQPMTESLITTGITATATKTSDSQNAPANVVDGDFNTPWNAGAYAPQAITLSFAQSHEISHIDLFARQVPDGQSYHTVYIGDSLTTMKPIKIFNGPVKNGDKLSYQLQTPTQAKYIRVETAQSPSYIAWNEIQVYEVNAASPDPTPTPKPDLRLGGMNLDGYCQSAGGTGAGFVSNAWVCVPSNTTIVLNTACTWQYGSGAFAKQDRPNDQYSWACYRADTTTPTPTPTVQPTNTPSSILFFGDSITDDGFLINGQPYHSGMYAATVTSKKALTRLNQTANDPTRAAIAGSTLLTNTLGIPSGNQTFDQRVKPFAPEKLVVYYGTNDYQLMGYTDPSGKRYDLTTWRDAWEQFYASVGAMPSKPSHIYILGLGLIQIRPVYTGQVPAFATSITDLLDKMDAITKDEATLHGATFVPLRAGLSADMYPNASDVHPNQNGHTAIANMLLTVMNGFSLPTPKPTGPIVTSTPNPLPSVQPKGETQLGGMDLDGYCKKKGVTKASLSNNAWTCAGNNQQIDLNAVCQWQYSLASTYAKQDRNNDPYSYMCYTQSVFQAPSPSPRITTVPQTVTPTPTSTPTPAGTTPTTTTAPTPTSRITVTPTTSVTATPNPLPGLK